MSGFSSSTAGRLMTISMGVALTGSGLAAVMHSPAAVPVMSFSLLVPAVLNIVGLPQALEEHWQEAVLCAIFLPPALFLYAVVAAVLAAYRPDAGYLLVALGLGAFGVGLRSTRSTAPSAPAPLALTEPH